MLFGKIEERREPSRNCARILHPVLEPEEGIANLRRMPASSGKHNARATDFQLRKRECPGISGPVGRVRGYDWEKKGVKK